MGAMVNIFYDMQKVSDVEVSGLVRGVQQIVKDVMAVKDVFIYAQKPLFVIADPIEIVIQVNKDQVAEPAEVTRAIAKQLTIWKQDNQFKPLININIHPVEWHFKIGI